MTEEAFRQLIDPYRGELQLHCYRILGSLQDAEDAVQETLLAAWRGLEGFEGRASLRAWLYRIATNRCLNALRDRGRRPQQVRLEPYPDVLLAGLADARPGPEARYETRESVALAFVAALQHLPARQRAALVLRDVLGFRTVEVAEILESSEASVKGALQRARGALEARIPAGGRELAAVPSSGHERELVARFADAVERGDTESLIALLVDDALLTMPPLPLEYQGHEAIASFLREREERRGAPLRVMPTGANGQPALACYLPEADGAIARPRGLIVLTLEKDAVAAITWFADTALFRHFGLPDALR